MYSDILPCSQKLVGFVFFMGFVGGGWVFFTKEVVKKFLPQKHKAFLLSQYSVDIHSPQEHHIDPL